MLAASFGAASKTTFPLWMYVRTFPHPAAVNIAARSIIGSRFLPPTLTPRRSAMYTAALLEEGTPDLVGGHIGIAYRNFDGELLCFVSQMIAATSWRCSDNTSLSSSGTLFEGGGRQDGAEWPLVGDLI